MIFDDAEDEDDEDDDDEFDTIEEAKEYAVRLSWEIFEEVLEEVIKDRAGASGVLDVSNEVREQMCMELVFPDVWEEMDA